MNETAMILLVIGIPVAAVPLISLFSRRPNIREGVSIIAGISMCGFAAALIPTVLAGNRPGFSLFDVIPGLPIAFEVEPLGALFALIASFLWIVTTVYSTGYMRANREASQTRFYACFALALACTAGIAFAGNMFTLFLFYEALTLSTYPLVTHSGTAEARRSGRVYLGILLSTSIMLQLLAMLWTWVEVGSLDFVPGGLLTGRIPEGAMAALLVLYIFGVGKAAIMPFHRWLPAAMVAPAPVSALLHAVAVVKAGVFTILKIILYIFGLDTVAGIASGYWLIYVAGATILIASIIAVRQDNLKLRLAYSTIGQLSYIVLGAALANAQAFTGSTMHIAAHAFGKVTLFFCAGAIYTASGKTKVSELAGLGRSMPWTMGAFAVASLVMIGVPPSAGFVSKWYLLQGALTADNWFAVGVIVMGTILATAYLAPIVLTAFFAAPRSAAGGADPMPKAHGEAPLPMVAALVLTAAAAIALFFCPNLPLALARLALGGAA